jgi:hypothetical protein
LSPLDGRFKEKDEEEEQEEEEKKIESKSRRRKMTTRESQRELPNFNGVYICKSEENDLRHGNLHK